MFIAPVISPSVGRLPIPTKSPEPRCCTCVPLCVGFWCLHQRWMPLISFHFISFCCRWRQTRGCVTTRRTTQSRTPQSSCHPPGPCHLPDASNPKVGARLMIGPRSVSVRPLVSFRPKELSSGHTIQSENGIPNWSTSHIW